jgi:RNA polymerase sigma-70 factor (ECF subfamily)
LSFLKNIPASAADDNMLINSFKTSGDIAVLGELYQRYMDMAYSVCLKYLRNAEVSKDAVMDIFEELNEKLKKHEVVNFRSWLYTVVKNHCLMKLRAHAVKKPVILDENLMQLQEDLHQQDVQEREWQFNRMTECIERLAAEQKRTIELFYLQQKCYKEICEITGYDWNKVRSLVQNGRRNLKICMERGLNGTEISIEKKNKENITDE